MEFGYDNGRGGGSGDDSRDTVESIVDEQESLDSLTDEELMSPDFSEVEKEIGGHSSGSDSPNRSMAKRKCTNSACADGSAKKQMRSSDCSMDDAACSSLTHSFDDILISGSDEEALQPWFNEFQNMSIAQQQKALCFLVKNIPDCHIRTLRHVIEPLFQKNFLQLLPEEIAFNIISCLRPRDIITCSAVSRRWRSLCDRDKLWKGICEARGYHFSDPPSCRFTGGWSAQTAFRQHGLNITSHMTLEQSEINRAARSIEYGSVYEKSPYKSLYMRRRRIYTNWHTAPIQASASLKGHDEHVITCLQIHGDKIVTGSDDNTLRVWSIKNAKLLFVLSGHLGGVWTSQISEDGLYIVSGSTDRTVRVWCAEVGAQLHVLQGHSSTVRCMALHKYTLVSGSRDQTLRVWDIKKGVLLQTLIGHIAAVRCVQFDGKRVVSGAYDFSIKVWDAESGECVHSLEGHTNRVYSLLFEPERDLVISGSLDTNIRVWNIAEGRCIAVLVGHHSLTSGMQLRGNILVSCNADADIRVWDIRNGGRCICRLQGPYGHTSAITSLQLLEGGLLATSSDDGTVKLWDIARGTHIRDLVRLQSGNSGGCIWRLRATDTLLVCAIGSRNGTEDTKILLLDFDASYP